MSKRDVEDSRTIGELFYLMIEEVADITFSQSMQILVDTMLATVQETFQLTDVQVESFHQDFLSKLPTPMNRLLQAA